MRIITRRAGRFTPAKDERKTPQTFKWRGVRSRPLPGKFEDDVFTQKTHHQIFSVHTSPEEQSPAILDLCFRDGGLVWTVGQTVKIKLRFEISLA